MNKIATPDLSTVEALESTQDKITVLNPVGYPPKVSRKSAAPRLESLDGKTVCTATGSTPERRLREETQAEVVTFDTYSECAAALTDDRVDAVSTDNVILLGLIQESDGAFKLVGEPFSEEPYGIGLKKGADDLRSFVNDVLEASYADGSWAAAYEATVGQVDEATPEPPAVDRY